MAFGIGQLQLPNFLITPTVTGQAQMTIGGALLVMHSHWVLQYSRGHPRNNTQIAQCTIEATYVVATTITSQKFWLRILEDIEEAQIEPYSDILRQQIQHHYF